MGAAEPNNLTSNITPFETTMSPELNSGYSPINAIFDPESPQNSADSHRSSQSGVQSESLTIIFPMFPAPE